MFEEIFMNINWVAVIIGAVAAYALGALWYSPKLFGTGWMKAVGLTPDSKGKVMPAMVTQAVGTFLLAWVIGITETTDSILTAIMIAFTIAVLIKANGLFAGKGSYAIKVEAGYVIAMVAVMVLAHAIF